MREIVTKVRPQLYLGGVEIAKDKSALKALEITYILNCAIADCDNYWAEELVYLDLPLKDKSSEPIDAFFYPCYRFISAAISSGNSVLIHCLRGVSRSSTILLSYLILQEHCPYQKALEALRTLRPCVSPNLGYQRRLQVWSDRLLNPRLVLFPRVYLAGYIGNKPCMRLREAETGDCGLDPRLITVVHSDARIWIWKADNKDFQPAAEELVEDLQRFEGASTLIIAQKDSEPELFWQDFSPHRPSNPYHFSPINDRFLTPMASADCKSEFSFYIYPDIISYSHISKSDIAEDSLVLHYCPALGQILAYVGGAFEPDLLSSSDYIHMVQSRIGVLNVVNISLEELQAELSVEYPA